MDSMSIFSPYAVAPMAGYSKYSLHFMLSVSIFGLSGENKWSHQETLVFIGTSSLNPICWLWSQRTSQTCLGRSLNWTRKTTKNEMHKIARKKVAFILHKEGRSLSKNCVAKLQKIHHNLSRHDSATETALDDVDLQDSQETVDYLEIVTETFV